MTTMLDQIQLKKEYQQVLEKKRIEEKKRRSVEPVVKALQQIVQHASPKPTGEPSPISTKATNTFNQNITWNKSPDGTLNVVYMGPYCKGYLKQRSSSNDNSKNIDQKEKLQNPTTPITNKLTRPAPSPIVTIQDTRRFDTTTPGSPTAFIQSSPREGSVTKSKKGFGFLSALKFLKKPS